MISSKRRSRFAAIHIKPGRSMPFPTSGNSQLFFYRKDLFEKHSLKPPSTWNDVLAAAKTIHEKETTGANGGRDLWLRDARGPGQCRRR